MESQIPLELLSSVVSVGLLIALFVKYYQYKKKLEVLKGLNELKKRKKINSRG